MDLDMYCLFINTYVMYNHSDKASLSDVGRRPVPREQSRLRSECLGLLKMTEYQCG